MTLWMDTRTGVFKVLGVWAGGFEDALLHFDVRWTLVIMALVLKEEESVNRSLL